MIYNVIHTLYSGREAYLIAVCPCVISICPCVISICYSVISICYSVLTYYTPGTANNTE